MNHVAIVTHHCGHVSGQFFNRAGLGDTAPQPVTSAVENNNVFPAFTKEVRGRAKVAPGRTKVVPGRAEVVLARKKVFPGSYLESLLPHVNHETSHISFKSNSHVDRKSVENMFQIR